MNLEIGKPAPDIELQSHLEKLVRLKDYRGKHILLAFFPQAWTPI